MSPVFRLTGVSCADCAAKFERKVASLPGVTRAELNFGAVRLVVEGEVDPAAIAREAEREGISARLEGSAAGDAGAAGEGTGTFWQTYRRSVPTGVAALALLAGWAGGVLGMTPRTAIGFYAVAILVGGYHTFRRGLAALILRDPNMNALMTIAVAGAIALGEWWEGATVAFLYSVSNTLESYSIERARASIRSLVTLAPKEATVRRAGRELRLPVEDVAIGDIILVRPGELIAMDGEVVSGHSSVDQSTITGESLPSPKQAGDDVYAGTINRQGFLEVRVTRAARDTTLAKIVHLVEEAQAQRAPSQTFVDRFARYYTPVVLGAAIALGVIPSLVFGQPWPPWIYRALVLVVVSCPCALVVSTPVSVVTAIGNAARHGVLIKGGVFLEQVGTISAIALDKTGTLTAGRPDVMYVKPAGDLTGTELLRVAAAVEHGSEHPLAEAIVRRARAEFIMPEEVRGFESYPGKGVRAELGGESYYVGNLRLFEELGVDLGSVQHEVDDLEAGGQTTVIVGSRERVLGVISVADAVRPQAREAVTALREAGVRNIIMLTGDNRETARAIARELGIDDYRAQLLPQDKARVVKGLMAEYGRVAMVGDGVNDAPALATATVGIAMGVAGTDTAIETADIALMADDLTKLPFTIRLGKATLRTIKQNIAFSLLIKAVAIAAVFPGWLTLWLAILGDMGATLIVTANGLRLLRLRPAHRHAVAPTPGEEAWRL